MYLVDATLMLLFHSSDFIYSLLCIIESRKCAEENARKNHSWRPNQKLIIFKSRSATSQQIIICALTELFYEALEVEKVNLFCYNVFQQATIGLISAGLIFQIFRKKSLKITMKIGITIQKCN